MSKLNGIFIIPTGLACTIGGDAGANPHVKLIANCCNNLIVNPNSVNASDINQMPDNCWYTEGNLIDTFLEGKINLKQPKTFNKILMVVNPPIVPDNVNAMNAGIWGIGAHIEMLELKVPLVMKAHINEDGTAGGSFSGADELIEQVKDLDFDALAIQTKIDCSADLARKYFKSNDMVNPWGGVESIVSKYISSRLLKPLAHSPIEGQIDRSLLDMCSTAIVKQSMAPEIISKTYSFCMFVGLHRAPRVVSIETRDSLTVSDIDFLVTPHNCWGRPHIACEHAGIPIIVVKENTTCFSNDFKYLKHREESYPGGYVVPHKKGSIIFVDNYLEAAGVIMSMNAGVNIKTILLNKGGGYIE